MVHITCIAWNHWSLISMNEHKHFICIFSYNYIFIELNYFRMRKLSSDNRWRNSPRHKPGADQSQTNGQPGPYGSPRHLTSAITRQLTFLRESWSRHFLTLSQRINSKETGDEVLVNPDPVEQWIEISGIIKPRRHLLEDLITMYKRSCKILNENTFWFNPLLWDSIIYLT